MQDDLIRKIAKLMTEQSSAYSSLESLTSQLVIALTRHEPISIDSLTRAGETELIRMRSRLLEITNELTAFSEIRTKQVQTEKIDANAREEFEIAAKDLLKSAQSFEKIAGRATSLALSGSSFATACIQMCGIVPTTYGSPVLKYGKGVTR